MEPPHAEKFIAESEQFARKIVLAHRIFGAKLILVTLSLTDRVDACSGKSGSCQRE